MDYHKFRWTLYGLWFLLPLIPILSPYLVTYGVSASVAAWMPVVVAFFIYPVLQIVLPYTFPDVTDIRQISIASKLFLESILLLSIPLQAFILIAGARFVATSDLNLPNSVAYIIGVGSFSSFCSINIGHELIHPNRFSYASTRTNHILAVSISFIVSPISRILGILMLSATCFGSFYLNHLKVHHLHVGTPKDVYTAKRGDSLYTFMIKAHYSNIRSLFSVFTNLRLSSRLPRESSVIVATVLSVLWIILFSSFFGFIGAFFFVGQSIVAIFLTEWINYLQHYGITRSFDNHGRFEPVREWHSWNEDLWLSDIYMLNLFRHADHHINPAKPFYCLAKSPLAPRYPYPYIVMMFLSLWPSKFFFLAHKVLDSHPFLSVNPPSLLKPS